MRRSLAVFALVPLAACAVPAPDAPRPSFLDGSPDAPMSAPASASAPAAGGGELVVVAVGAGAAGSSPLFSAALSSASVAPVSTSAAVVLGGLGTAFGAMLGRYVAPIRNRRKADQIVRVRLHVPPFARKLGR